MRSFLNLLNITKIHKLVNLILKFDFSNLPLADILLYSFVEL